MSNELTALVGEVNSGITVDALGSQIPQIGGVLVTLVVFGIGFVLMRRVLRGAKNAKAKV